METSSVDYPDLWTLRPAYKYHGRNTPAVSGTTKVSLIHGNFLYTGCDTGSALAYKINKDTMVLDTASVSLTGDVVAMCYDALNNHILIATTESPARIYICDLNLAIIGSLVLNGGEGTVTAIIHDGTYAYVICGLSPTKVVALTTNATNPVRVSALTLAAGENLGRTVDYDTASNIYIGCPTSPGKIVKVNNNAGTLTRVLGINLSISGSNWNNCGAVVLDRYNASGKLYALSGATSQLEVLFQIEPTSLVILNVAGGRFEGLTFTDAVLDTLSSNPGKYLYATAYDPVLNLGITEAWDIGSQGGGLRSSRRYTMDYPDAQPWAIDFDGTFLYIASNTIAPVPSIIKMDKTYLGLTLYLRPGYKWIHPIFGEGFSIVGLDNPITRMYGAHGRVSEGMVHLVQHKDTFKWTRKQAEEDMVTILNCKPFGFLHDWGEYGRAVSLFGSNPEMNFPQGPQVPLAEITMTLTETAI